ncbi:hypothetical protein GWI33_002905 [Rhynchophorus ferrugineus]|uniref:Proteasome subunit beta n=1 Tax=Rhynchophorus ferrugineus TaxID=354439 RepID=A0A834IM34_RHYFE|nr:hypothetical protein GWI33_002905 [Rhynchophorus ferrugineus]
MSVLCPDIPAPGFSFENCRRNVMLENKGLALPKATKTGTTIVGIIYKDGVILGADTRATEDTTVADKNCEKIHYLAPNICCGAGTAADTEMTTQMISSQLELHRLYTNRVVRVATANQMLKQFLFRYQGYIGAALVLGGVDSTAMAVFESRWKPDMEEAEGVQLVRDAIAAGIFNDLGSGSNVDVCIIRKGAVDYRRTYDEANKKGQKQNSYKYPKGTTAVLTTKVVDIEEVVVKRFESEEMDTA